MRPRRFPRPCPLPTLPGVEGVGGAAAGARLPGLPLPPPPAPPRGRTEQKAAGRQKRTKEAKGVFGVFGCRGRQGWASLGGHACPRARGGWSGGKGALGRAGAARSAPGWRLSGLPARRCPGVGFVPLSSARCRSPGRRVVAEYLFQRVYF